MPTTAMKVAGIALLAASCLAMGTCGTGTRSVPPPDVRAVLASARALLDAGEFERAAEAFTWTIQREYLLDDADRAAAHFGRGLSVQELLRLSADAPGAAVPADTALTDYLVARSLDSATYFVSARYNAALLHSRAGRHETAADYLLAAADAAPEDRRPGILLRAARELEAALESGVVDALRPRWAELRSRAGAAGVGSTAEGDSALVALRLTLARRPLGGTSEWTLHWLSRLLDDSARAPAVAEAAVATLGALSPGNMFQADSLVVVLAIANVRARTSPEVFDRSQRGALEQAVNRAPRLADALRPMIAVYDAAVAAPPSATQLSRSAWWDATPDRRRVWSSALRNIGQWHERDGREEHAVAYYMGALGYRRGEIEPWSDLDAVLPLVLILDRASGDSTRPAPELDRFLDAVFSGKSLAYREEDLPRIRQFHMTLGAYYAGRGQWGGAPRGAIFQLERMRETTAALGGPAAGIVDPPELIERLMSGYLATNRAAEALRLLEPLKEANDATGRVDSSTAWEARIGRPPGARE